MAWKVDENSALVVDNGNPVWEYEDGDQKGQTAPVEFKKTLATITNLKAESIGRKDKLKEIKDIYKPVIDANIEDIGQFIIDANEAIEKVANFSDKDLVDAGEVEKVKQGVIDSYERQITAFKAASEKQVGDLQGLLDGKDSSIRKLIVRSAFDTSEFLSEKTVLLPDFAFAQFGSRFAIEEVGGELKGYAKDKEGNKLMSLKNPGEYAEPDEAIELLIMEHPQKDRILRQESSGSGAQQSGNMAAGDLKAKYQAAVKAGRHVEAIKIKNQIAKQKK